ncbi:MAG: DEAD/DEAH box helicase [Treponema sp.]|jgi:ATP-dependent RNA helicase RhlB|nr:DEAD/DEAH box helicase [Treponema sp.]
MEFKEFNLHPDLQRAIDEAGYVDCMPVQEQVLTSAFGGQDLYVQSQTGTGKTAAFLIVIFQRLLTESLLTGKKALIMTPTRELAVQVETEAKALGKYLPFKAGSFYGGVGYIQQQKLLRENAQIMVGTPGRVLDLNKSGHMNLMDIAFLVLDEADRMFDMGFYPDLRKLIKVVPPADRRQTMLFSATLNAWVKNLAWEYTKSPLEIEIAPETVTVDEVDQVLYHVPSGDKMRLLLGILGREKPESAIVFCNTKRYAEIVAKRLRINGIECEFIIGDLPQSKRLKIIDDIKAGAIRFLVATDVAARGLDIESLAMVINYDLPVEAENYVHRIGRTARAGKTGRAITLASEQDVYELPDIEKYIGKKIPSEIAGEALYAEDASEGMRVRTSFFEDRRDDRTGRGDPRRTGGRDRGDRDRGHQRPGDRREAPGRPQGRGRRPPPPGNGAYQEKQGRDSRDKDRASPQKELSGLSFEERMSYYKEKYRDRPRGQAGSPQARRQNAPPASARQREERPQGGSPRQGGAQPTGGRRGKGNPPSRQESRRGQKQAPPASAAAKRDSAAPGNIISRILSIFKKGGGTTKES